jgi:hypothetical protein
MLGISASLQQADARGAFRSLKLCERLQTALQRDVAIEPILARLQSFKANENRDTEVRLTDRLLWVREACRAILQHFDKVQTS